MTYHPSSIREVPRRKALLILSDERGRSPQHPLTTSLISKWCADLGFPTGLRYFTNVQFQQLQEVNRHYAAGGTRRELLQKLKDIQNGNS